MWFQHQYGVWHDRTTEVPLEFSCEVIDKLRHFHAQDRKGCSLLGHVWRQAEVRNLPAWHSCHVNPWSISSPQHPWKRGESWPSCWCPLLWVVKAKETKKLCGWSGNLVSIQFKVPPPVKYSTMTRYVTDVTHCSDFWLGFSVWSRCWLLHPDCKKSIAWWVDGGSRCKNVRAGYPSRTLQAEDFGVHGIFSAFAKVSEIFFDAPEVGSTHLSNRNLPRMLARRDDMGMFGSIFESNGRHFGHQDRCSFWHFPPAFDPLLAGHSESGWMVKWCKMALLKLEVHKILAFTHLS